MVAAVIYSMSYFLAPKGRPARVNTNILETLVQPSNINKIKWCSFIMKTLRESSSKIRADLDAGSRSVCLDGCLLLLQVENIHRLGLAFMTLYYVSNSKCGV